LTYISVVNLLFTLLLLGTGNMNTLCSPNMIMTVYPGNKSEKDLVCAMQI